MLELLTAFLAFSAIMIMLSTLVTVIVEFVQKAMRMRRAGLQQMLEGLYETAVREVIGEALEQRPSKALTAAVNRGESLETVAKTMGQNSDSSILNSMKSAARVALEEPHADDKTRVDYVAKRFVGAQFAEQLMRNPNYGWAIPSSAVGRLVDWLRRFTVTHDFEALDTRQFIEQLANTEAGDELAGLGKEKLNDVLRTVAYQFERYGEAASDYFARRAWMISVVVAIIFAFAINMDALRVFRTLVLNPTVSEQVHKSFEALQEAQAKKNAAVGGEGESEDGQAAASDVEAGAVSDTEGEKAQTEATETDTAAGEGAQTESAEVKEAATADAEGSKPAETEDADKQLKDAIEQAKATLAKLKDQGVPIGRDYFPFCDTAALDQDNCDFADELAKARNEVDGPVGWLDYQRKWLAWVFSETNGWWWFFSTLLAGVLIGLGAPFWYDIYRKAALVLPIAQVAGRFASAGRKAVTVTPKEIGTAVAIEAVGGKPLPQPLRRADKATISPEELYDAFMRARSGRKATPKSTSAKTKAETRRATPLASKRSGPART